ncbi:MAG: aminotransferase class III-fold pyridoxal phosphate-dependent enzyme [Pirellula sp.]|jgi:4-aminobutyrate aminotransferase-like enzyme|nr:aminotransferase class III-fold pyridoxal phosphate-dependent enzyme [Pirellula sp.]
MLHSQQLLADPRIEQAKKLLQEALAEQSLKIESVRGPRPELMESYANQLARLAVARGGAPYFPYISSGIGNGPFVELGDGSVKLDFIVGIGVHGLGHSHPAMLRSTVDAGLEDTVMQGNLQHDAYSLEMCERLIRLATPSGAPLHHCLLSTSGAMANENSLKIAFHNRFPASRVICMDNCFAGRSIALAQLTDRPAYRTGLPKALDVDFIPMFHPADAAGTTRGAVDTLNKLLTRHPGEYACLWLELVAGEGGYYPGTHQYFESLCQICHDNNVLIIFDEVQTFSRLSQPFAFRHFGLDRFADIVTLGKVTQVCATLYGEKLKPKGPILSQTFTGATASIRAGLAVLDELESKGCFGENGWNIRRHQYFRSKLESLTEKYPGKICGPYGEGMMIAFTPGDGSAETAKTMLQRLYDLGLMGFLAGSNPNRIRFLPPPGITTEHHIDLACSIIEQAIAES